jgi:hypothetical protein
LAVYQLEGMEISYRLSAIDKTQSLEIIGVDKIDADRIIVTRLNRRPPSRAHEVFEREQ